MKYPKAKFQLTPSRRYAYAREFPEGLVIHYDASPSREVTISTLRSRGLHVNFTMEMDGTIYQHDELTEGGPHTGKARWKHVDDMTVMTQFAGIEINNFGKLDRISNNSYKTWWGKEVPSKNAVKRPNNHNQQDYYHPYTDEQEASLIDLCLWMALVFESKGMGSAVKFIQERIVGHDEIAIPKGRKDDPGGSLSWTMPKFRDMLLERLEESSVPAGDTSDQTVGLQKHKFALSASVDDPDAVDAVIGMAKGLNEDRVSSFIFSDVRKHVDSINAWGGKDCVIVHLSHSEDPTTTFYERGRVKGKGEKLAQYIGSILRVQTDGEDSYLSSKTQGAFVGIHLSDIDSNVDTLSRIIASIDPFDPWSLHDEFDLAQPIPSIVGSPSKIMPGYLEVGNMTGKMTFFGGPNGFPPGLGSGYLPVSDQRNREDVFDREVPHKIRGIDLDPRLPYCAMRWNEVSKKFGFPTPKGDGSWADYDPSFIRDRVLVLVKSPSSPDHPGVLVTPVDFGPGGNTVVIDVSPGTFNLLGIDLDRGITNSDLTILVKP